MPMDPVKILLPPELLVIAGEIARTEDVTLGQIVRDLSVGRSVAPLRPARPKGSGWIAAEPAATNGSKYATGGLIRARCQPFFSTRAPNVSAI